MTRFLTVLTAMATVAAPAALAAPMGRPGSGAIGFQPSATELKEQVTFVHNVPLMIIITAITLLVLGLLLYVMVKYNKRANAEPSKLSHNVPLEVAWTVIPALILVVIAAFTFPLLYKIDQAPMTERVNGERVPIAEDQWLSVKVQGNQWNWTYSYIDDVDDEGFPKVEFVSNPLQRGLSTDIRGGADNELLYLETDYPMVVPAGRYIRYYTAAADVIHSFAMPSFGIKTDAVPGRLNEGWFKVDEPGVYYGQCSELCGKDHAFMPIEIRVVPEAQYDAWYALMVEGEWDAAREVVDTIQPLATQVADSAAR